MSSDQTGYNLELQIFHSFIQFSFRCAGNSLLSSQYVCERGETGETWTQKQYSHCWELLYSLSPALVMQRKAGRYLARAGSRPSGVDRAGSLFRAGTLFWAGISGRKLRNHSSTFQPTHLYQQVSSNKMLIYIKKETRLASKIKTQSQPQLLHKVQHVCFQIKGGISPDPWKLSGLTKSSSFPSLGTEAGDWELELVNNIILVLPAFKRRFPLMRRVLEKNNEF